MYLKNLTWMSILLIKLMKGSICCSYRRRYSFGYNH